VYAGGIAVGGAEPREGRLGRLERVSLAIAAVWGAGLLAAAVVVPVYSSAGASRLGAVTRGSGAVTYGSATLVGVNGWGVLLVVGVPLVATALVGGALWRRGPRQGAGVLAWTIAGLAGGFNVLAVASIGVFVIPATACLFVACAGHRRQRGSQVNRPGLAS
jgi:hypothetical protein